MYTVFFGRFPQPYLGPPNFGPRCRLTRRRKVGCSPVTCRPNIQTTRLFRKIGNSPVGPIPADLRSKPLRTCDFGWPAGPPNFEAYGSGRKRVAADPFTPTSRNVAGLPKSGFPDFPIVADPPVRPESAAVVCRLPLEPRPRPARLDPRISTLFSTETPLEPADGNVEKRGSAKLYSRPTDCRRNAEIGLPQFFPDPPISGTWSPGPELRLPRREPAPFGPGDLAMRAGSRRPRRRGQKKLPPSGLGPGPREPASGWLWSLEEHGSRWPVLREPAFFGSEIKDRGHGSREPAPCKISAYFWFCGRFPQSELK